MSEALRSDPLSVPGKDSDEFSQFYIPATSQILDATRRILKQGDTFALLDPFGDVMNAGASPFGIFHEDTRHLSGSCLLIAGHRPLLLSSRLQDDNGALIIDLANPDIYRGDDLVLSREMLHIVRTKFLWDAAANERVLIQNFDARQQKARFAFTFAADFADLFEVRGMRRKHRGTTDISLLDGATVCFRYRGLDGAVRTTQIEFDPPPTALTRTHAIYDLVIAPRERKLIFSRARFGETKQDKRENFFSRMRHARHALRHKSARCAVVSSSNSVLNEGLCRSIADLYMLVTEKPEGPYPYAGIPWFSTVFGRDAIITALEMLWLDPSLARGVLRFLAATQAKDFDPLADAEPGKILHEMRQGEMAKLREVPFGRYYGSVDATPLFVLLAGRYYMRTGDLETIREIADAIDLALRWIDTCGDRDGDGFVEYLRQNEKGLGNQGWKDSNDSIMHVDGSLAIGPIALCEVQAYVYRAKLDAVSIMRALGREARARELAGEAETLRRRFEAAFWSEPLGSYALALDGKKLPCLVRSSNAGHALFAGIASDERAARVAKTLMSRHGFSGWGIRTLAEGEPRYNPMAYHNGSVWPHDNAMIAMGFARYALKRETIAVFAGLYGTLHYMEQLRLPELFCGFPRRLASAPTLYPVACSPQAWAAATPFAMIQAMLGLEMDFLAREIRFVRPELPHFVDEMCLRGLSLGEARVDLRLERHNNDVGVNVIDRDGAVRVIVVK